MDQPDTRQRIVTAADQLFYQHGYAHCSFSQIAESVGVSSGNFYQHFSNKDDILAAVIGQRQQRTRQMLAGWSEGRAPKARIQCFIRMFEQHQLQISRYGCPIGSLCAELTRLAHPHAPGARQLFDLMLHWLRDQFVALGRVDDADTLAMHLLASSQGVATLACTYQQPELLQAEVVRLTEWLERCCPD